VLHEDMSRLELGLTVLTIRVEALEQRRPRELERPVEKVLYEVDSKFEF
jgi:hypothetical protein